VLDHSYNCTDFVQEYIIMIIYNTFSEYGGLQSKCLLTLCMYYSISPTLSWGETLFEIIYQKYFQLI